MMTVALAAVPVTCGIAALAVQKKVLVVRKRPPFVSLCLSATSRPVWPPRSAKAGAQAGGLSLKGEEYPAVERTDFTEELHGQTVPDPYRWLEDPGSDATKSFIDAQNQVSQRVLSGCAGRTQLKDLISAIMDYPKQGLPVKRGGRWYFSSNTGLQNQDVMFMRATRDGEASVFFDPNILSSDGTIALRGAAFNAAGDTMAYQLSESGSDWSTIKVKKIATDGSVSDLPDVCKLVRFSCLCWTHDGKGFFYNKYDEPAGNDLGTETDTAINQKLYYHRLGTPQSSDIFLFANVENPTWKCAVDISDDGRWLWLVQSDGCVPANMAAVCDLHALPKYADGGIAFSAVSFQDGKSRLPLMQLATDFKAAWHLVAVDGTVLTMETNAGAPRNRLVAIDAATATAGALSNGKFTEVLPEHPKDLLQGATPLKGDIMVVQYMRDVVDVAELRRISDGGLIAPIALPTIGTMSGIVTEPRRASTEFSFSMATFVDASAQYRADAAAAVESGDAPPLELFHKTELQVEHQAEDYVAKQVFVRSKDGTKVPMFVVHHKSVKLDGSNPTLLYGYGGFNISLQPSFSASRLAWMKALNGVYALANLRGGGEYGRGWRDNGSLKRKQNVFDDMHACAQYLADQSYCTASKLTIQGGSNGGLLVAACANQRPDLYGCVLAQVGVLDMLRFHKFTIGHAWCTDFGDPDDAAMFDYLRRYSPYHNVAAPEDGSQYPAMLLLTASHDDRVSPLHTYKHLAELQYQLIKRASRGGGALSAQTNPLIARIETKAGHGAGKPTSKIIEEVADMWAFAAAAMGVKVAA